MQEVARLLDTRHPRRYKVYNLCSEKSYDSSYFHGRVERIRIDDHTVPPLLYSTVVVLVVWVVSYTIGSCRDIVRFCDDVKKWMEMDPNNVIAVHCKGGKGELEDCFH